MKHHSIKGDTFMKLQSFSMSLGFVALMASLPAHAQTYTIDPSHTYPSFEIGHNGISFWRGKFTQTTGSVTLDRAAKTGSVDITVDPSSINMGLATMDEHARGKDFFNVANYSKITYKGRITQWKGDTPQAVEGEMTLLGISKPFNLEIRSFKCIMHPMLKREVCGADAYGSFKRSDFGMKYGLPKHGDEARVAIQIEALKAD